ncbi:MAG: hypothetical protein VX498_00235, partial [Myxococcota bacterium]|nr:hypothetical protein [Myxococcota bacterium]
MSGVRLLSSWFFDALAPACLLGSGLFLASASISRQAAGNHGAWLGAWAAVSAVVLLAVLRQRLPSLPILGSWCAPPLWLAAGLLGAALLGKQAVEGLSLAAADLALSSSRLPGLDLAECLLLGSLLVLLLPSLLLGRLSVGLLPLRLLSLLGLALLLVGAVSAALRGSFASVPNPSLPEMDRRMILSLAALSWSVPALAAGFDWSGRVRLKRALVIGLGGALSMLLLPLL